MRNRKVTHVARRLVDLASRTNKILIKAGNSCLPRPVGMAAERGRQLAAVLQRFPPIKHAFAYGSGVHHQPGLYEISNGHDASQGPPRHSPHTAADHFDHSNQPHAVKPMIDYIFAVEDAHSWHYQNMLQNPEDYSWVAKLGHNVVTGIADHIGVGVHFNTLVPIGNQTIKYGVLRLEDLQDDLLHWRHLYISGRMQKPVMTLLEHPAIAAAQLQNTQSAAAAALLLLPGSFNTQGLLHAVCGLSYHGDIRMCFAEDPHKIDRIVQGSRRALAAMYQPLLSQLPGAAASVKQVSPDLWTQDLSKDTRLALIRLLPLGLLHEMAYKLGFDIPEQHLLQPETLDDVLKAAAATKGVQPLVSASLRSIVRRSSAYQAVAGLLASGGIKSFSYVAKKVQKAFKKTWEKAAPLTTTTKAH